MSSDETTVSDWWKRREEALAEERRKHEEHLRSPEYVGQLGRLGRLTEAAINLIHMSHLASDRMPNLTSTFLVYAGTDDALESIVAIRSLVASGVHNAARRECRYLLEQVVKHLYVDQKCPRLTTTRADRIDYLKNKVPRSSIEPIFEVNPLLPEADVKRFRDEVKGRWAALSGVVHPSKEQLTERAARARKGSFSGFETASDLCAINDQLSAVYDFLGVMWLTAAGPTTAGDIILVLDEDDWIFHKSKWLKELSRLYDYKFER